MGKIFLIMIFCFFSPVGLCKATDIVISITKAATPLKNYPGNVSIIGKEDMEKVKAENLDELITKTVPDINMQESQYCQTRTRQVTLRGVNEQGKTLVLVDDIPVQSPCHGWLDWDLISPENVERIEVVRGPVSSLYGSGAMGGVINIITKMPVRKRETLIKTSFGKMNTKILDLSQAGDFKKFAYTVNGRLFNTDGYIAEKNPQTYNIKRDRDQQNINSKFIFRPTNNSSFTLGLFRNNDRFGRGRKYSNSDMTTTFGYLSFNKELKFTQWHLNLYSDYHKWLIDFDRPPNYNNLYSVEDFDMKDIGSGLQLNHITNQFGKFTFGIDNKYSEITQSADYKTVTRESQTKGKQIYLAPFFQDEYTIFDEKLMLTLGSRLDWYKNYDGSFYDTNPAPLQPIDMSYSEKEWYGFCPKFALLYRLDKRTTFKTSVGKGFQSPSLPLLYTIMTRGVKTVKGNPELVPEYLWSYEITADRMINNRLFAKFTLYQSEGNDFIASRTIAPNTLQFDNISKVRMRGIETELKYDMTLDLSGSLGYSYSYTEVIKDEANPQTEGNTLAFIPYNKLIFGINYDVPNLFAINSKMKYTDKMYSDIENTKPLVDYWTFDIGVSKKIYKNIKVKIDCENVFDEKYDIPDMSEDLVAPGRVINGSVNVKF
ncbi:MAG: TonB-dependent receptor [Elusimicrobiota bacterium]